MPKIKPICFFLLFLIVLSIVFIAQAVNLDNFQASLVPISAAAIIIFLSLAELVRELRVNVKEYLDGLPPRDNQDTDQTEPGHFFRRIGLLACWVGGLTAGIYYLGFLITNPVFIFSFLKARGTGWLTSLLAATIASAVLYWFFEVLLERRLWRGQIFW